MSNPRRILERLDANLSQPAELHLFGRAALALGFPQAPTHFHSTQDVDGILPLAWLQPSEDHHDFWEAVQRTNLQLEPDGLYLTHLFREVDVIIQPDWMEHREWIELGLVKLAVYRPSILDLILTKMARGDGEDLQDIGYLLTQRPFTREDLERAFARARVPDIPEIQELFHRALPKVLDLAGI